VVSYLETVSLDPFICASSKVTVTCVCGAVYDSVYSVCVCDAMCLCICL
jgi:hypothetical protein